MLERRYAESQAVSAKALPVAAAATTESEKDGALLRSRVRGTALTGFQGYKVPEKEKDTAAHTPATTVTEPEPKPTAVPEPVPAPAPAAVSAATPRPAPAAAPKKKKAGLFASCCGKGDHLD
jgi:hypothetical protein